MENSLSSRAFHFDSHRLHTANILTNACKRCFQYLKASVPITLPAARSVLFQDDSLQQCNARLAVRRVWKLRELLKGKYIY